MSRGVRDLHELICVSRLSMRSGGEDDVSTSDDDFTSNSFDSSTSGRRRDPIAEESNQFDIPLDSGFTSHDHLDTIDPSFESEVMTAGPSASSERQNGSFVSPRSSRKLRRSLIGKSIPDSAVERSASAASGGIEVREGFVQSHDGDFDDLLTYLDSTVVSEWVTDADSSLRDMATWCHDNYNFIRFAHWWLSEFPSLDRVALIRLERSLLRDQVGFAFVSPPSNSACRPGDISCFLSAVFAEYPRRLLGAKGPRMFLDYLDILTADRGEAFRQLLTNVRCSTNIKQHAQWTLATRSFCLISLWSAVITFYRQLVDSSKPNQVVRPNEDRDECCIQDASSAVLDSTATNEARIYTAMRYGYADVVHYLLSSGKVSRSLMDSQGRSLVFHAVVENQTTVLHYLLQRVKDMDVNTPASSGNTPLHAAANAGSIDIVKELLKVKRLKVDACNTECDNATALHVAIIHGHLAVVQLLLDVGADPLLKLGDDTALSLARAFGHEDIADIITTRIDSPVKND